MSPNTERRYRLALRAAGVLDGHPEDLPEDATLRQIVRQNLAPKRSPQQRSSIEDWRDAVAALIAHGYAPTAIHARLCRDPGFAGSLSAVKRMCLRIKRG